ncbi:MAG: Omp28-related outer membrane protein, partial [Nitrospiraceae bacterium]|nr:Omp28-related outer membrane protein [Nitrospiraceae bacterium]
MKKLTIFLALIFLFSLSFSNADNVKRILLEQHTGAWCGWCVDGSYVMDNVIELYPDRVIGVKVHNGDSMAIADGATIESAMSCPGFPSAMIDRKDFDGAKFVYRDTWQAKIEDLLSETAKVSVDLYYQIDEDSRELTATIVATPLESISGNLTFNVLICEDSVSGKGKGWDQHNYLSGLSGYEDNPYYNEPSVIVGYEHVKVVRAFLGGPFGLSGELAETPYNIGTPYTHEFTTTLPENWDINHIFLVGLIAKSPEDGYEIMNSCYGIKGAPRDPIMTLSSTNPDENSAVIATGSSFAKNYTLENIDSLEHTFSIELNISDRTPSDWTVVFQQGSSNKLKGDKSQENEITL